MFLSKASMLPIIFLFTSGVSTAAETTIEPAFCNPSAFQKTEISSAVPGLRSNHAYQLGNLVLVGLAVGKSDITAMRALSNRFSQFELAEKNCTWYFNDGNPKAAQAFHHRYVSNPSFKGSEVADEYEKVLASTFAEESTSFMSCAVDHGYIAMGCDGMKHRGPSVFAMILSFAGCSAQNSTAIANMIWGANGVAVKTREAIAEKGKVLGDLNPALRQQLQVLMTTVR